MKKYLVWTIVFVFLVAIFICVAPSNASTPSQTIVWDYHQGGGQCADGSDYGFWSHEGTSDNLLIVFQGGGLCWDAFTCQPVSTQFEGFNDYYLFRIIDQHNPNMTSATLYNKGLLDLSNPLNPFQNWDVVQLPMCTGDLGIGTKTLTYPNTRSIQEYAYVMNFDGSANINSTLNWIFATHPSPSTVGILGLSAGGPASVFHAPTIFDYYQNASVGFQISDSLAMVHLHQEVIEVWGGESYITPNYVQSIEYYRPLMVEQVIDLATNYPTRFFGEINSETDASQALYEGVEPQYLIDLLDIKTGLISNVVDNYRYWTHAQHYHSISTQASFYAWAQNSVYLYQWVAAIASGTPLSSQHFQ